MAASTRSIHSRQRAAGGQVGEFDVEDFFALSPAAARRGAHRPYSRNVGRPENSRAAPSATSRSNSRRAARPVIGAWRAASAGETQSSASSRSTIFAAGFARSLGATAMRISERRERSAARSRAEAAASAIAPAAVFGQAGSPGLGRRPAPGDRRPGSRIFVAISGSGRGQRSRMAMTMSNAQRARISASGRWGVREGGERQGGGLCGRRNRIALPCASLQAGCEAVRVRHSQVEPRRRVADPAWVEAGRPAGEIAPQPQQPSPRARAASPTAKRRSRSAPSSALRRRILAEAAALMSARRERSAPAAGGSRRRKRVEEREPGAGGEQGIALPCPSARPRPGRNRRGRRRKGLPFQGFRRVRFARAALRGAARERPPQGRQAGRRARSRSARITWRMVNSSAALCHLFM